MFKKANAIRLLCFIVMSLVASSATAGRAKLYQCSSTKLRFQNGQPDLSVISGERRCYLIKNMSRYRVILNRADNAGRGVSAGWASYLDPDSFSVLHLEQRKFRLRCLYRYRHASRAVPCQSVIKVCRLRYSGVCQDKPGGYWQVENARYLKAD